VNNCYTQACEDGDLTKIEELLASGFKVNAPNPLDGFTGLHYAADTGNTNVVKLLITKYNAGLFALTV